jgi:hypothetical protein
LKTLVAIKEIAPTTPTKKLNQQEQKELFDKLRQKTGVKPEMSDEELAHKLFDKTGDVAQGMNSLSGLHADINKLELRYAWAQRKLRTFLNKRPTITTKITPVKTERKRKIRTLADVSNDNAMQEQTKTEDSVKRMKQ